MYNRILAIGLALALASQNTKVSGIPAVAVPPKDQRQVSKVDYAENLGFRILGTITGGDKATVLIKNISTKKIQAIKVHTTFLGIYIIEKIEEKSLLLNTLEGKKVLVYADAFAAEAKAPAAQEVEAPKEAIYSDNYSEFGFNREGNKIKVDQGYMKKMLHQELPKILMQAGAEPVMENGQITGFRFFGIDNNSIYAKAGIKDGDVVTNINGKALDNVGETVKLLQSLKNAPNMNFGITRDGQSTTVSIDVK
jgi:general secretion pathway protein C